MKKLFLLAVTVAGLFTSAFAGDENVSRKIKDVFTADFQHASNVSWKITKDYVKATFVDDNQIKEAYYTPSGEFIGDGKLIGLTELPAKFTYKILKDYSNYSIDEVIEFHHVTEGTKYYLGISNPLESIILEVDMFGTVKIFKKTTK